jgi:protein-S-isoprenylcysteine O-methyltransferase Ste14
MDDRLAIEVVALLFGSTWVLVGVFGAVILRWEKTGVTEARRRELEGEREGSERLSVGIRVWRVVVTAVLVGMPLLFAIDGLVYRLGILYAPSLTFSLGPDLVLQIAGIVLSAAGLALLIGLGRKLAVNVYRLAVHERELMTTGFHRYVRHPFYVHFFLIPVGSFLLSLNYLSLLLFFAYTMLWEPKPLTAWMREEEDEMRLRYGTEGEAYLQRTGRVFPRLRRPRRGA